MGGLANIVDPGQTAPIYEQSDQGVQCLLMHFRAKNGPIIVQIFRNKQINLSLPADRCSRRNLSKIFIM